MIIPVDNAIYGEYYGAAEDDPYMGVPSFFRRRYAAQSDSCDVVIYGVPFDSGCSNRPGARFAPRQIRVASGLFDTTTQFPSLEDPFSKAKILDGGDCPLDYSRPWLAEKQIQEYSEKWRSKARHQIAIGGDNSVTLPLLRAYVKEHGPVSLLHFDAHQDTWFGNDRISHGTFVRQAIEEKLINSNSSVQIGIRTAGPDMGIKMLTATDIKDYRSIDVAKKISSIIGSNPVYLSFDIDAIDPAFAPGTGTPVPGGLSSRDALDILWGLNNLNFVGMDIVEVNPMVDVSDITSLCAATLVLYYVQILVTKLV